MDGHNTFIYYSVFDSTDYHKKGEIKLYHLEDDLSGYRQAINELVNEIFILLEVLHKTPLSENLTPSKRHLRRLKVRKRKLARIFCEKERYFCLSPM